MADNLFLFQMMQGFIGMTGLSFLSFRNKMVWQKTTCAVLWKIVMVISGLVLQKVLLVIVE
jgi:hypothetical protein